MSIVSSQDTALCELIAATNIGDVAYQWSCDIDSIPTTPPCGSGTVPVWYGVMCQGSTIITIELSSMQLSGTVLKRFFNFFSSVFICVVNLFVYFLYIWNLQERFLIQFGICLI